MRLLQCQGEKERLAKAEQERLCKLYIGKKNESDVRELRLIYSSLFGHAGEGHWQSFMNEWCETHSRQIPEHLNNEKRNHSTLPSIPDPVQQRLRTTQRNLHSENANYEFNYDLLQVLQNNYLTPQEKTAIARSR